MLRAAGDGRAIGAADGAGGVDPARAGVETALGARGGAPALAVGGGAFGFAAASALTGSAGGRVASCASQRRRNSSGRSSSFG